MSTHTNQIIETEHCEFNDEYGLAKALGLIDSTNNPTSLYKLFKNFKKSEIRAKSADARKGFRVINNLDLYTLPSGSAPTSMDVNSTTSLFNNYRLTYEAITAGMLKWNTDAQKYNICNGIPSGENYTFTNSLNYLKKSSQANPYITKNENCYDYGWSDNNNIPPNSLPVPL